VAYTYANLKEPKNLGSGISDFVLIAPVKDFDSIKAPTAPFTNPGDEVTIKTAHVFKDDKAFAKFALAPEKNSYDAKTIGDTMFQKLDHELKIFIPGSYAEAHEAVKNIINTPLIVLVKDSNCGADLWYQLGNSCVYAYAKFDFSTGTTKDGVKGYSGTVTFQSESILIYSVTGGPEVLAD
jgi:hypothetical protein